MLDTVQSRRDWWSTYFRPGMRPSHSIIAPDLAGPVVACYGATRLVGQTPAFVTAIQQHGLVDLAVIAVTDRGTLAGVVSFCGNQQLDPRQALGLTLVAYAAFSHQRADSNYDKVNIAPRELTCAAADPGSAARRACEVL